MTSKHDKVKSYFDQTENYLRDNYNIRFRREIVQDMVQDRKFKSILDIACGSGEVSIPFLNNNNNLTLLDISQQMLDVARKNIPHQYVHNVEFIQANVQDVELPPKSYDLIICLGLLAHVDDIMGALEKIIYFSAPGGTIILQNTNSSHPYSFLLHVYHKAGVLLDQNKYNYNKISESTILKVFNRSKFILLSRFCYIQTLIFFDKYLPAEKKYNLLKLLFNPCKKQIFQIIGNECVYFFKNS